MQNKAQNQVIDPILTNHARGYKAQQGIGFHLFPRIYIPVSGVKILKFGKEDFKLANIRRAPTANRKRIHLGHATDAVTMDEYSLSGEVPLKYMRDASAVPGINLGARAVNNVSKIIALETEFRQASIALNASNYAADSKETLAGGDKWNTETSKPKKVILDAKEVIRRKTGMKPNVMAVGATVHAALCDNPAVQEQFKYSSGESITIEMLKRYFDVDEYVVGESVYANDAEEFTDIWGNQVVLANVEGPNTSNGDMGVPSFGYTYTAEGHPFVEEAYFDRDNSCWVYPVTEENSVELVGMDAGYLIEGVV